MVRRIVAVGMFAWKRFPRGVVVAGIVIVPVTVIIQHDDA